MCWNVSPADTYHRHMWEPDTIRQLEDTVRRIVREEVESAANKIRGNRRLALTLPEAAEAVGYSLESVRAAIRRGELAPAYANSKPVVMVEELERWLRSLPADGTHARVWHT